MYDFISTFISCSWAFFQIKWPGCSFTIGQAFLAVFASLAAFRVVMRMTGTSLSGAVRGFTSAGGNNNNPKIPDDRKGDTK